VVLHSQVEGTIKRLTIRRSATKKWYVSFLVEDAPKNAVPNSEKAVGIDVGISNFAVFSDGTFTENQRYLAACEMKLAKAQSKKDKLPHNSPERRKAAKKVSHIYQEFYRKETLHGQKRAGCKLESIQDIRYVQQSVAKA
jgi:putative transposase